MKLLYLFLLASNLACYVSAGSYNTYPYLYSTDSNKNISFPVQDYIAPEGKKLRAQRVPGFLKASSENYRVVEFYVSWCGLCKLWSVYYVKLAKKLLRMVPDKKFEFHAISCVPNRVLCQKQKIKGYPALKVFRPGDGEGVLIKYTDVTPLSVLNALAINTEHLNEPIGADDLIVGFQATPGIGDGHSKNRRTREDIMNDVHLSFDFAMRNSIFMEEGDDKLSREAKRTLKNWLKLMRKTIPLSWVELQKLLEKLTRNFGYISKNEGYLMKYLDQHRPPSQEWSLSCSMGEPGRGYTCGLWELFHTVTVGVVDFNKNQVDEKKLLPTEFVARTIRNYVDHFFHCDECREHFIAAFDSCAHDRCTELKNTAKLGAKDETNHLQIKEWEKLPLWLFQSHNAVNERLLKEKASRELRQLSPKEIQASQWPPLEHCASCWTGDMDRKTWEVDVVKKFLQLEYGAMDESMVEFQRNLAESQALLIGHKPERTNMSLHMIVLCVCAVAYAVLDGRPAGLYRRKLRTV